MLYGNLDRSSARYLVAQLKQRFCKFIFNLASFCSDAKTLFRYKDIIRAKTKRYAKADYDGRIYALECPIESSGNIIFIDGHDYTNGNYHNSCDESNGPCFYIFFPIGKFSLRRHVRVL